LIAAVAIGLYVLYSTAVLFNYLPLDRADVPELPRELYYALTLGAPAVLLGLAVGHWWAPLAGVVFLALLPFERTVHEGPSGDITLIRVYNVTLGDALLLLVLTTPCVIVGVMARKLAARSRLAAPA
jgi:hypothetical protein